MKLSKTTWISVAIGILVIAFVSLSMAYSQQDKEQSQLNQKLSLVQLVLTRQSAKFSPANFSSQQKELESRLAQTESLLKDVKADSRPSIQSIEVTDTFFEIAKTSEVKIIEIRSTGLTSKTLEEINYSVLSLEAKAEGDVTNLINFILELSMEFPTGVMESVKIGVSEMPEGEETGETEGETEERLEKPLAIFILSIHTYEGD